MGAIIIDFRSGKTVSGSGRVRVMATVRAILKNFEIIKLHSILKLLSYTNMRQDTLVVDVCILANDSFFEGKVQLE